MKTLIILRHGKAEPYDSRPDDFDRVLADRGRCNASAMGKYIFEMNGKPSLILSSPAKRTMETAALTSKETGYSHGGIMTDENLYLASARRILMVINKLPDDFDSCLLVGHNPGLTDLVNLLKVRLDNLPTGSSVCFTFETQSWSDISAQNARFQWIRLAREL